MIRAFGILIAAFGFMAAGSEEAGFVGLVQDATGGALVSTTVTAMNEDSGVRRKALTNGEGIYQIRALPPGLYRIVVRKPGFQSIVRLNVNVSTAEDARLDFVMQVGSMREVVTVEGGPAPINTNDGSVGTVVSKGTIDSLPVNGRGVMSIVELTPGIVATPASSGEAGQFSTNGLRANTNYFTVDGLSANTGVTGAGLPAQFSGIALPAMTAFGSTHNLVSLDALDEVRILTSSFEPQYGRLPGAQVALTSRSGSNEYHGSAFYALRNEALDANDWFANAYAMRRSPLRLNHWGATFGGPLRLDKTFFFASYEALRLQQPQTVTMATPSIATRTSAPPAIQPLLHAFTSPTGADLGGGLSQRSAQFSRPSRLDALSLRIDHALTNRVSLFGRYNRAPSYAQSGFAQIEHTHLQTASLTFGAFASLGPTVTNDLRTNVWNTTAASHWSANPSSGASPLDFAALLEAPPSTGPAIYGVSIDGVGGLYSGVSGRNRQRQWNLLDTIAMRRARHDVRLGFDYVRLVPRRESAAESIVGVWNSLADVLAGGSPTILTSRAEQASALIETLSVFAQDTWSVSPRLKLTYGIRWELTPPPSIREPSAAFSGSSLAGSDPASFAGPVDLLFLPVASAEEPLWRGSYNQLAPRIGAAFRVNDSSVIRAGWGIFHDLGFGPAMDPINGFPFNRWQFSSRAMPSLAGMATFGPRVAPNLRLPYVFEWNIAYEQMFGLRNVVSLSYVGSSGRRLLRYEGVQQPGSHLSQFAVATNHGASNYNGLELQFRRRLGQSLQANLSYTWSHAIDNGSWDSGLYLVSPDMSASSDRGSSSFDVRHNFTVAMSYALPQTGNSWTGWLTRNWDLGAFLRARSGFPIDVRTRQGFLGLGFDNISRPDLLPGVPVWIEDGTLGGRRLNPEAFRAPNGVQGNLGRNPISGAEMFQLDLSVKRRFPLSEGIALEFRAEAYNALNHPNSADPVPFLDSPFFGRPISMLNLMLGSGSARSGLTPAFQIGGPRSLHLSIRLQF